MPNEENLIPLNQRTKSEQRKIQSDGGTASGVSRRRKRSLREATDLYLSLPVADRKAWNRIAKEGIDPEDINNQMAMIIGLSRKAIKGDARAAKVIVDLLDDSGGIGTNEDVDALSRSLEDIAKGLCSDVE